jgi:hypothetical protein
MDPDACLDRLIDAATTGDAEELRWAADDLAGWLERGGFRPRTPAYDPDPPREETDVTLDDDWIGDDPSEPSEPTAWQRNDAHTEPGGLIRARCETNDNLDLGYPSEYASWELTWPDLHSFLRAVRGGSHQGMLRQVTVALDGRELRDGQPIERRSGCGRRASDPLPAPNAGARTRDTAKDGRAPPPTHQPQERR